MGAGACFKLLVKNKVQVNPEELSVRRLPPLVPQSSVAINRSSISSVLITPRNNTPRNCSSFQSLSVKTSFKDKWIPTKLDYTPTTAEEKIRFLFYCPICFCHAEGGAKCNSCAHHCCFDCVADLKLLNPILTKQDVLKCPHCREMSSVSIIKCKQDIERNYEDSPRTISTLVNLQQTCLQKEVEAATKDVLDTVMQRAIKAVANQEWSHNNLQAPLPTPDVP
tara:strand:+ start:128 stop:796 length:669 start_codon:yes stop_codon:yes gene_type:complete